MRAAVPAKLQVVMGKGGVGRTTIAAALALVHARAGSRVGLVSLADGAEMEARLRTGFGVPPPSLQVLDLDPRATVDHIVGRLLHVAPLAQMLTAHPAYDAVYRIAPGVKELGILHRLLELADTGAYDRLVVDGFASGHGTHFLEAPRKSARMLVGQLAQRAARIDAVLTDPGRTAVVLATTPEEMPVRETVDLVAMLRHGRFPVQAIVANRVPQRLLVSEDGLDHLERLAERPGAAALGSEVGASWKTVQRLARAAVFLERTARDAGPLLAELAALGPPLARVPFVAQEDGRLRAVVDALEVAKL